MKLNKHLYALVLLTIMAISCSNTSAEESTAKSEGTPAETPEALKEITIKGKIENGSGQDLILQYLKVKNFDNLDTVKIKEDGSYKFEFMPPNRGFYRVMLNDQNLFVLVVSGNEDIVVDGDASNLYQTYEVKKGEESQRLQQLNRILGKRDSIGMVLQTAQMNRDQALFNEASAVYEGVLYEVDRGVKQFIDEKPASFSSLAALQNLNPDNDFSYYLKVIEALDGKANGNEYYDALSADVMAMKSLAPGSEAPEISLPQPNGEVLSLSDFRGSYVLIDFWASWCGPCRRENPNVKRVYEKYHDKGFEILGVSLDKNKSAWLGAIEQDGLTWNHVSDLQYWNSSVVPDYKIQGIPLTVLVDKEGKIIAKNLRGQDLENKLAQILGN